MQVVKFNGHTMSQNSCCIFWKKFVVKIDALKVSLTFQNGMKDPHDF